jgi:hypothetical protein
MWDIEAHPADPLDRRPAGASIVVDPPDGRIPYRAWALTERDWRKRPENQGVLDPEPHCFVAGAPRDMWILNQGQQIVQNDRELVILHEYIHQSRFVDLARQTHLPRSVKLWSGDSIGRWDGTTLVVDTTNRNGKTWFEFSNYTSESMHSIERFTMVDPDTILYEARIEDATLYTTPWTLAFAYVRTKTSDYELLEQACQEDNLNLEHLKQMNKQRLIDFRNTIQNRH